MSSASIVCVLKPLLSSWVVVINGSPAFELHLKTSRPAQASDVGATSFWPEKTLQRFTALAMLHDRVSRKQDDPNPVVHLACLTWLASLEGNSVSCIQRN